MTLGQTRLVCTSLRLQKLTSPRLLHSHCSPGRLRRSVEVRTSHRYTGPTEVTLGPYQGNRVENALFPCYRLELLWVQITQSLFRGRKYRWGVVFVECHVDPYISKATTVKERVVTSCAESQSTLCDPNNICHGWTDRSLRPRRR